MSTSPERKRELHQRRWDNLEKEKIHTEYTGNHWSLSGNGWQPQQATLSKTVFLDKNTDEIVCVSKTGSTEIYRHVLTKILPNYRHLMWFHVNCEKCVVLDRDKNNLFVIVYDLSGPDTELPNVIVRYHLSANVCARLTFMRAWVARTGLLMSPLPAYDEGHSFYVMFVPYTTKYIFSGVHTMISHWCSGIHVSQVGDFFVLYDFEDDYCHVYRLPDMKEVFSVRSSYFPTGIVQLSMNKVHLMRRGRWEGDDVVCELTEKEDNKDGWRAYKSLTSEPDHAKE